MAARRLPARTFANRFGASPACARRRHARPCHAHQTIESNSFDRSGRAHTARVASSSRARAWRLRRRRGREGARPKSKANQYFVRLKVVFTTKETSAGTHLYPYGTDVVSSYCSYTKRDLIVHWNRFRMATRMSIRRASSLGVATSRRVDSDADADAESIQGTVGRCRRPPRARGRLECINPNHAVGWTLWID